MLGQRKERAIHLSIFSDHRQYCQRLHQLSGEISVEATQMI